MGLSNMSYGTLVLLIRGFISTMSVIIGGMLIFTGPVDTSRFTVGMMLISSTTAYWLPSPNEETKPQEIQNDRCDNQPSRRVTRRTINDIENGDLREDPKEN